jgi:DNA-directed RNA polymerase specialized sigma24 family protein
MTESQRKKKDEINQLAVELAQISRETDEAVYQAKWFTLYNATHSFFSSFVFFDEDSFQDAILLVFQKFDPKKSSLTTYLERTIKCQGIDAHRKIYGRENKEKKKKGKDFQGLRFWVSLDDPVGNSGQEGSITLGELLEYQAQLAVESNQILDSGCYELASQILNFAERHNQKNGSSTKLNYFKLFYTSGMTSLLNDVSELPDFTHIDEMTIAMKFPFVDYCMVQHCRTLLEIFNSDLRLYGEVVENAPDFKANKPIPTPIPDIVGINYLSRVEGKQVSPSTYSEQWTTYRTEMRDALQRQSILE